MKECIDIFSRLLIATITFVVPILINLLSTFTAGEKRRKELALLSEEEINKQLLEEVQENPKQIRKTVDKTSKQYKDMDKKTKREINLLNPIIQFWNIFASLVICLVSLFWNYIIRNNTWNSYNHNLSVISLVICGLSYISSLFFIIRILYTISKTKKIIELN